MAHSFAETRAGYAAMWDRAKVLPAKIAAIDTVILRMRANQAALAYVERQTGVPWYMIGCMLWRESDLDFDTYLGNGQRLDRVTTEVPAGRGPFKDFYDGAIDALTLQGITGILPVNWTIERVLYWLERFNGQGYFSHGNSPYLWSWTDQYAGGKFTSDHHFDPNAWDQQGGCAAVLKRIEAQQLVTFTREAAPAIPAPAPATAQAPPMTTPTTTVTVPTAIPALDLAHIEATIKTLSGVLPFAAAFIPPPWNAAATAAPPIAIGILDAIQGLQGGGDVKKVLAGAFRKMADDLDPPKPA